MRNTTEGLFRKFALIVVSFFVISFGMPMLPRFLLLALLYVFCFPTPLHAEEALVVHVGTQVEMTPLYIAPIKVEGSGFDKNYVSSLEKVIQFDWQHNGKTELVKANGAQCRIEIAIAEKKLQAKLTLPANGGVKGIEGISLVGELSRDRQTLHHLHDTLFQLVFGTPGIANTRVLYTLRTRQSENATQWISDVWQADYDGGNAKQITHDQCLCVTPVYIPVHGKGHCRHFLYVSYKIGQPKIYAASLGEDAAKRLTFLRGNQLMPAISPACDQVAFISDITGNPDLFLQDFSLETGLVGKPRQIFCAPGGAQGTPTFNPDGKKVAFVSNKDGTPRIYILDVPLAGASIKNVKTRIVSKKTKENTCPAWSPDGKKIAYSALTAGVRQIWIYDIATGEETQLTEGGGHKENPAWAPNSLHVIYNNSSDSKSDLYIINLNQKEAVKITQGVGEKRFPAWESHQK